MWWSWDSGFDFEALLDAASGAAPWLRDAKAADQAVDADPEADEAAYREAVAAGRVGEMPLSDVAGRIVDPCPPGRGWQAGWRRRPRMTSRTALWPALPRRSGGWPPGPRRGTGCGGADRVPVRPD
jgi:hypothetical protein